MNLYAYTDLQWRNMRRAEVVIDAFNARTPDEEEGMMAGPRILGGGLMVSNDVVRRGRDNRKVVRPASMMPKDANGNGNSSSTPKKGKSPKKGKGADKEEDKEVSVLRGGVPSLYII